MFRIYQIVNPLLSFQTLQEAIDGAIKRSGEMLGKTYYVVEEIASVQSKKPEPPIETKITPIKDGFRV